jgi:hypothetical protein
MQARLIYFRNRAPSGYEEPIVRSVCECEVCLGGTFSHHYEHDEDEGVSEARRQRLFSFAGAFKLVVERKLQLSFPVPPFTPTEERTPLPGRCSASTTASSPPPPPPPQPPRPTISQIVNPIPPPPSMVWRSWDEREFQVAARPRPRGRRLDG